MFKEKEKVLVGKFEILLQSYHLVETQIPKIHGQTFLYAQRNNDSRNLPPPSCLFERDLNA